jgi:hypothetical protein
MATLGPNDLKNVSLPTNWDSAELRRLGLRDGTSYADVIADINGALGMVNDTLTSGWLANMLSTTTDPTVEYAVGSSNGYEEMTEYGQPDARRANVVGHMLPIKNYDRKLSWTQLFFEEARRAQIDADIASAIQDTKDIWEKQTLTRYFKSTADTGAQNGVGAAGKSVPLADGGTADSAYVPYQNPSRGGTFTSGHTHFLRLSGITQANVETAANHLWEHGHDAPYILLASNADAASWVDVSSVTGFVTANMGGVLYSNQVSLAQVPAGYQGVITTKRGPAYLMFSGRIPTGYWGMFKSYGANDQRNPLRVRYDENFGLGVKLEVQDVSRYPLRGAITRVKFGVGIGSDRTNGVAVLNAGSGSYSSPTIS